MDTTGHHMGIVVSDLEASVAFYRDRLGLSERTRLETDPEAFGSLLGLDRPAPARIAFLDADGLVLELEEHEAGRRDVNELADPVDVGYPHLCLEVDDLAAVHEAHRGDLDWVSPPGAATGSGARIAYLRDPDDNLVELIEVPE